MKTRAILGISLAVVGILASLAFIGTNQPTLVNQESEKTPILISPKIQEEPTKETVKVESNPEPKTEVKIEPERESVETEPTPEPVETEPTPEPVQTEPVQTEPVQTEPVQTEPVQTEPVQTEPVQTEPVKEQVEVESNIVCSGNADCIRGKVTKINDGDTIKVNEISVRFALTSTPKIGKSGGIEARDYIEEICPVGSDVVADEDDGQTEGSYGRTIAKIYCNGFILNESILEKNLGEISTNFCSVSEFASEPWAKKFGC